jgi:succinoglycan biosynthesis transport protein ExoP
MSDMRIPADASPRLAGAELTAQGGFWSSPVLLDYWNAVRRHLWLVLAIIGTMLILGVAVTLLMTPQFTALSRIQIAREQANVTNVEALQRESENANDQEFYLTQYSLLNARSLAERVERRLRLARSNEFFEAHGETPEGQGLLSQVAGDSELGIASVEQNAARQRQAVKILLDHISIEPLRGSALVDVSYSSGDPQLSQRVASAWVEEFVQQSMDRRLASTADARVFLEERLQTLRERLEKSERDLVNYARRQGIVRLAETQGADGRTRTTQTLASSDLEQLNRLLVQASAERSEAETRLTSIRSPGSTELALNNQSLNLIRESRAEAEAEYQQLLVNFEPEYPAAQAAAKRVEALDRAVASEETRIRNAYVGQFQASRARELALRARVDQLLDRLETENRAGIQYNNYSREVDTNRQLYDALLQRYKEIGVAGVGMNNISVIDQPIIPEDPSSPNFPVNLAIALLFGLVLAAGAVIVLENVDESVHEPDEVTARLNVPLLGAIPSVEDDALENIEDPKSILSEAYMTVRTNLGFSTTHGVPKSIAFTSTSPSEGKSTSAFSLARVLGRTANSVVLVDFDMRRPVLAGRLGLLNEVGVSNYLTGDGNWSAMLQQIGDSNVYFMAAGPTPPSASELLTSDRASQLIKELGERFDHVIVDGPPMLGLSDAPLISRAVEGVIYVIEAQRTAVRGSLAAIGRLRGAQAQIFGALLTKYRPKQAGYGYGYGYGYGRDHNSDEA